MRKILTIAMAAVLAFGAFAMSGCGDKTFKGNYKTEATAEEVRTALTGIDLGSAAEQSGGFEMDFKLKLNTEMSINAQGASISSESGMDYKGDLAVKAEGETISGAGKISGKTTGEGKSSMNASMYIAGEFIYLDMKLTSGGQKLEQKIKMPLSLDGVIPFNALSAEAGNEASSPSFDVEELIAMMERGVKVYLDESDGTKIKISVTKEFLMEEIGEAGITLSDAGVDIYVVLDENDALVGVKADMKIKGETETSGMNMKIDLNFGVSVKSGDVKVALPSDLDSYPLGGLN